MDEKITTSEEFRYFLRADSHETEPINPTLKKLAFIPVIVEKDEKTWDMVKITLIDSNNKPFRDEWGDIYSAFMPTHALLHSEFQSPEYKKQLLSYFIITPKNNPKTTNH